MNMYLPPPFFINTATLSTYREGNEDYVKVTFGYYTPPDKKLGIEGVAAPVVTLMMSRYSWKCINKQFQGFLAKQEEGINEQLPPL